MDIDLMGRQLRVLIAFKNKYESFLEMMMGAEGENPETRAGDAPATKTNPFNMAPETRVTESKAPKDNSERRSAEVGKTSAQTTEVIGPKNDREEVKPSSAATRSPT